MATIPAWFDGSVYMTNKLKQMQTLDPDSGWTADKLVEAFTAAGFIGEEGYYNHFKQFGNTVAENVSPNSFFVPYEYYQFKALQYFQTEAGGSLSEDTIRGNLTYYGNQIKQFIEKANMTAWDHYQNFGSDEGVNPSNAFDEDTYLQAKVDALAAAGTTMTKDEVKAAIKANGMTVLGHYMEFANGSEGEVASSADVSVPSDKKVNDDTSNVEGATLTLTTGADYADANGATLNGGTITSDFKFSGSDETVTANAGTLGDNDILIDSSTTDNDVINATMNKGWVVTPTLTNIETINVDITREGSGLNLANVTGAKTVSVSGSQNGWIAGLTTDVMPEKLEVKEFDKQLTMSFSDLSGTTKGGDGEEATITLTGTGTKAVLDLNVEGAAADTLETLNIVSSGKNANSLSVQTTALDTDGDAANDYETVSVDTLNVSGSADLNLSLAQAMISGKTLDASELTGKLALTVDRDNSTATVVTNMTNVKGVTEFVVKGTGTGANITNVTSGANVTLAYVGTDTVTVKGAGSSTSDALTVTIDPTAAGGKATDLTETSLTIADVETLNVVASGAKSAGHTLTDVIAAAAKTVTFTGESKMDVKTLTAANVETITLDGDESVTFGDGTAFAGAKLSSLVLKGAGDHSVALAATTADALTIDGSAATGKLTIDAENVALTATAPATTATLTINGGSSDDKITAANKADTVQVLDGGAGDDEFIVSFHTANQKITVTGGDGADTIKLTDSTNVDGKLILSDFELGSDGDSLVLTGSNVIGDFTGGVNNVEIRRSNPAADDDLTGTGGLVATKLNVLTGESYTGVAGLGNQSGLTPTTGVLVAFINDQTGQAEIWFDDDGNFGTGSVQVATIGSVTTTSSLAAFDAANISA